MEVSKDVLIGRFTLHSNNDDLVFLPNPFKSETWNRTFSGEVAKGFLIGKERYLCIGDKNYKIKDLVKVLIGEKEAVNAYSKEDIEQRRRQLTKGLNKRIRNDALKVMRDTLAEIKESKANTKAIRKANPRYYSDLYYKWDAKLWQVKIWNENSFILGGFHKCKQEAAQEAQEIRKAKGLYYFNTPYEYATTEQYEAQREAEEADQSHVEFTEVEYGTIRLRQRNNFLYKEYRNDL